MSRPAAPQETRLDLNALEVRGAHLLQRQVLETAAKHQQLGLELAAREQEAATLLAGRVPAGVTIHTLRLDVTAGVAYAVASAGATPS